MGLFTKEFLDELSEKCGATLILDHYINDLKMSFQDAILKLSNFHGIIPQYCDKGYSRPLSEEAKKYLYDLYEKNECKKASELK